MKELEQKSNEDRQNIFRIKKTSILFFSLFLNLFSSSVFYNEDSLKIYITISIFICLLALLRGLKKPNRLVKTAINGFTCWLIILFTMYFYYGLVLTKYHIFNADYFFFMFVMTLVNMLLFVDVPIKVMMEIFIKACVFASVGVCLFIFINEWSMITSGVTRIGETGSGNVNTIAVRLGIMSIPCLYKMYIEKKYRYFIPYIIVTLTMLLTGSKKSLIFIIIGFAIFTTLKNKFRFHKYIIPLLLVAIMMFLIFKIDFLYNIIGRRLVDFIGAVGFNIDGAQYSRSTTLRLLMYKKGLEAFETKPIFGGGWFYFAHYTGMNTYSHSNYIELLVTYGIFGFSIYYSMFLKILIKLFKLTKIDGYSKMLFTMILLFLVNDFAAVQFSANILYYLVLCFGYLYIQGYKGFQGGITKNEANFDEK